MLRVSMIKRIGVIAFAIVLVQIILLYPKKYEYISANTGELNTIYVFDNFNYVSQVTVKLTSDKFDDIIHELFSYLSSEKKLKDGFTPPIPKTTKLLNYKLDDNNLILNFSNDIYSISPELEEKMYEAIIYTFTSLKEVNSITINVNGNILDKMRYSDKKIPKILDRSFKINKVNDCYTLKDVQTITLIHPAILNDYLYYIPVTKYTDDKSEKIEIIIEELKSAVSMNSNVISYLNEETKLIDYKITDKSMILNFNNKIFSDLISSNIKEEITYSLNSSIDMNYKDIDNILYYVNDYIVNNYFLPLG